MFYHNSVNVNNKLRLNPVSDNAFAVKTMAEVRTVTGSIGVFDSGVGGLSVALAIRQLLPHEDILYIADTAHAPYGNKDDDYIFQRMYYLTQFMVKQGVKAIVVACNTATTAAISKLRAAFLVPIIGVEPGVKPAVYASKSSIVGVLATPRTLLTPAFASLAKRYEAQAKVILQPCPALVPLIESLVLSGEPLQQQLRSYIDPLLAQGADTLVLGCTHYNFIADEIAAIAGQAVTIIRTEQAVAKQLQLRLQEAQRLNGTLCTGSEVFYSSGDQTLFARQLQQLWPNKLMAVGLALP